MTHYKDYIADPMRDCAIVAHRGAWRGAPENSLAAIERAIAVGANIVEIDIRKSADGELFVMHDDTLLRIALREDDGGAHRAVSDQRIPTLKQALDTIRGRIFADLDLKDRSLFSEVAACARDMGAASYVDLKTTVANREELEWVRAQNIDGVPFMAMAKFTAGGFDETMALLAEINPFMCEMRFDHLETIASNRQRFLDARMALWINTLDQVGSGEWRDDKALADPDSIWGRLMDAGITVFQTDRPEELKAYIKARRA
jgi:hypothetical protein